MAGCLGYGKTVGYRETPSPTDRQNEVTWGIYYMGFG